MGTHILKTGSVGLVQKVLIDKAFIDHSFQMPVYGGHTDGYAQLLEMVMNIACRHVFSR